MLGTGSRGPVWFVEVAVEAKLEVEDEERDFCPLGGEKGAVMAALRRVLFIVIVLQSVVELMGGVEMTMPWCGLKTMLSCCLRERRSASLLDGWRRKEGREKKERKERGKQQEWNAEKEGLNENKRG